VAEVIEIMAKETKGFRVILFLTMQDDTENAGFLRGKVGVTGET
jgi:hypothetical protein